MLICRLSLKGVRGPVALVGLAGLFAAGCGDDGDTTPDPADSGSTSATASVGGSASARASGSTSASARPSGSPSSQASVTPGDGGGGDGGPVPGDAGDGSVGDGSVGDGGSVTDGGSDDDATTPVDDSGSDAAATTAAPPPPPPPDSGPACGAEGAPCCELGGMGGGMGGGAACEQGLVCDRGGIGAADDVCEAPVVPDASAADAGDGGSCGGSGQMCCPFADPGPRCEDGQCSGGVCP